MTDSNELDNVNPWEELHDIIRSAAGSIEEEFERTSNPWLSCYGSIIYQVETLLTLKEVKSKLGHDGYEAAKEKLERVKEQLVELKEQHRDDTWVPQPELKRELMGNLNVLQPRSL